MLAPGELAVVPVIAADRRQARQVLGYLKGLARLPAFRPYVKRVLKEAVELRNGITVECGMAGAGETPPSSPALRCASWGDSAPCRTAVQRNDTRAMSAELPARDPCHTAVLGGYCIV